MKLNTLDKLIGYFSPGTLEKRLHARGKAEFRKRAYEAASTYKTDDWNMVASSSANTETRGAIGTLRDKARHLVRNNAYANKAVAAIVSNTVGDGIKPNIKGRTKRQTKQLMEAWKEWADTPLCDANGKLDYYGLQALVMRSIVESGEVLSMDEWSSRDLVKQIRILEADYIDSSKDLDGNNQGIKLDDRGRPISYHLFTSHPGDSFSPKTISVDATKIQHIYRQDRAGQLRGVTWFHAVIRKLEDFEQYQMMTLISRKIQACFSAFITVKDDDIALSPEEIREKRQSDFTLEPGVARYLSPGEDIRFASPTSLSDYDAYTTQTLRSIAAGLGLPYEAFSGDYSKVNFSSGRMGHLEFRRNVDLWRWNMLIPQFCDPTFKKCFLEWCKIRKGIDIEGVQVEWVPPAWVMIDPAKEISAMNDAIRSGLTTLPRAIKELGYEPDEQFAEIAQTNDKLDELGLVLDSDPRKITKAGQIQSSSQPADNQDDAEETDEVDDEQTDSQNEDTSGDSSESN